MHVITVYTSKNIKRFKYSTKINLTNVMTTYVGLSVTSERSNTPVSPRV